MIQKKCNRCHIDLTKKNAIIHLGYMRATCSVCKKLEAREYQAKIRKLKKDSYYEW